MTGESERSKYYKSKRKGYPKQVLSRNLYCFGEWESVFDDYGFSSQFEPNEPNKRWPGNTGPKNRGKRGFQFSDNDFVETVFQSVFGGNRRSFRYFVSEEKPGRSSFYTYTSFRYSQNWGDQFEDEYDSYTEPDYSSKSNLTSERKALGLTATGPLKLEEVKKAYRVCALKWHPDRHQGSSKVAAEEEFKICSAAYNSLCDKLALK